MSGPARKPTNLKVLHGTFRADRAAKNEPRPEIAIPDVPEHLSDQAKVEWARVSEELAGLGLLSRIDRATLAAYCECWSDWVDACRMCAPVEGVDQKVRITTAGNLVENPYYSIKKRAAELMHKFAAEFGMTPAARAKVSASPPPDGPDDNLLD